MGNSHSAELAYLFDFGFADRLLDEAQRGLSGRMMDRWAAFARDGDPDWAPYTVDTREAMVLGLTGDSITTTLAEDHHGPLWSA
jgi:para-nitrobenzyl esterase